MNLQYYLDIFQDSIQKSKVTFCLLPKAITLKFAQRNIPEPLSSAFTEVVTTVPPSPGPLRQPLQPNRINIPITLQKYSLIRMHIRPCIFPIPQHITILT